MPTRTSQTIAIAGECLAVRPFADLPDAGLLEIRQLLQASDVAYAHLEMNFGRFDSVHAGRGDSYGSYMLANPRVARDLRWLGVDMLSMANNHSLDFGENTLLSTLETCRAAGISCAGAGHDLDEARAPSFADTASGRVALLSTASGNKPTDWAGRPKETVSGRPGINPLRVDMSHEVDSDAAESLRVTAARLGILRTGTQLEDDEFQLSLPGAQSTGELVFRGGDAHHVHSRCHPGDLAGNLRAIRAAAAQADVLLVAHHFNVSEGPRGDRPPAFVREFAHAAIDEGADVFLGHGWHRTLGIEIYRGRPIFYGLGNLFAQSAFLEHVPADGYETWGHDTDRLPAQTPELWPLHPGLDPHRTTWWSSAIISVELLDGHLESIRLHPVELGEDVGRPRPAFGDNAVQVLERLGRLSEEFGTDLKIDDGVGSIHLDTLSAVGSGG